MENCAHVISARHSLQQHIQSDRAARDLEADSAETRYVGKPVILNLYYQDTMTFRIP